ncbi:MAG: hypothetical protein ACEPOV_08435 [Hyphomicrobiales bacterium]
MKSLKFEKSTIANLNVIQLDGIQGGINTNYPNCKPSNPDYYSCMDVTCWSKHEEMCDYTNDCYTAMHLDCPPPTDL